MPLETATYISDLVATNPAHTDGLSAADSHMRLLKSTIKATFPNITGAANVTQATLNNLASGTVLLADGNGSVPSLSFINDPVHGWYRNGTELWNIGRLRGNGTMPVGAIVDFPELPPNNGAEWLECNGALYNIATFPALAQYLGTSYGGDGITTFGVPNTYDTGRYRRSRSASIAAGSLFAVQANQLGTHTHTAAMDVQGAHAHVATVFDSGHTHSLNGAATLALASTVGGVTSGGGAPAAAPITVGVTAATTGITVGIDTQGAHQHNISVVATGGSETRPETFVVVTCIKT